MDRSLRFTICTIDGELEVKRFSDRAWTVHFPGGEHDDMLVSEQAVATFRDPYVRAAVEAVIAFEERGDEDDLRPAARRPRG